MGYPPPQNPGYGQPSYPPAPPSQPGYGQPAPTPGYPPAPGYPPPGYPPQPTGPQPGPGYTGYGPPPGYGQPAPPPPPRVTGTDFLNQPTGGEGKSLNGWIGSQPLGTSLTGFIWRDINPDADVRPQKKFRSEEYDTYKDGRVKSNLTIPLQLFQPYPPDVFQDGRATFIISINDYRGELLPAMEAAGVPKNPDGTMPWPEKGAILTVTYAEQRQIQGFGMPKKVKHLAYQRPQNTGQANGQTSAPAPAQPPAPDWQTAQAPQYQQPAPQNYYDPPPGAGYGPPAVPQPVVGQPPAPNPYNNPNLAPNQYAGPTQTPSAPSAGMPGATSAQTGTGYSQPTQMIPAGTEHAGYPQAAPQQNGPQPLPPPDKEALKAMLGISQQQTPSQG